MQRKYDIEEFLKDAKRNWKDKYEKYYYHTTADQEFEVEEKEKKNPRFDPIKIGWTQGVIDTLEWVLNISETEQTLTDIHIAEKYRVKLETFTESIDK